MPDSAAAGGTGPGTRDKRERLVAAASELAYRQGVERTTLADIAKAAGVRLGNVYYYFKTKDDLIAAVVQAHIDRLEWAFAELEHGCGDPRARLKAMVGLLSEQGVSMARFGCPYGSLCSELTKRTEGVEPLAARLMRVLLDWSEQQFLGMGRRDAQDLAVEFVAGYQGSAVLAASLGQPELLASRTRRLEKWVDALAPPPDDWRRIRAERADRS